MPKTSDRQYYLFGLRIAGDFGATIAVPIILFAYIGQRLDENYGTGYKLTALGFLLAALLSAKLIIKKAKTYGKEYEALTKDKPDASQNPGQDLNGGE